MNDIIYFNPHLPCGRRRRKKSRKRHLYNFNPHLPCGRRRYGTHRRGAPREFQSTPSLRKATVRDYERRYAYGYFNPHLPCGRRRARQVRTAMAQVFQSTPSLRKATMYGHTFRGGRLISIHTFLAEGDLTALSHGGMICISIHTFLAEGDQNAKEDKPKRFISIHTFLAEGDRNSLIVRSHSSHFNPHLPCGRRRTRSGSESR